MKTVKVNNLLGNIEIPDAYDLVRKGKTQPKDLVCADTEFRKYTKVKAGGVPVSRYNAVLRPTRKTSRWKAVRKF